MLDKFPIIVDQFRGVKVSDQDISGTDAFNPSYLQDVVNIDEAFAAENIEYLKTGGFKTRNGFEKGTGYNLSPAGEITGFWEIKSLLGIPQTNRFLVLTWDGTNGRVYDTGVVAPATNPVLTIPGMKYAFVINAFEKMWLTPWSDWGVPMNYSYANGQVVQLYTGAYNFRWIQDQGAIPGTFAVANSATAGVVTAGYHQFAVAYETDSGYIGTIYYFNSFTPLNANGNQISVTNIPTGPTGTVARHIIMTKIISPYPNPLGQTLGENEPFFVYRIPDNTTTTYTINTPDSGLVESAAYLLDKSFDLRPCLTLAVYRNRMIYLSPNGVVYPGVTFNNNAILISPPGDPETVSTSNADNSLLIIGQDYNGRVQCGAELRGTFYIFKEDSTFAIAENPDLDPMEWTVNLIDSGLGAYPLGVASVGDNPGGLILDNLLVANNAGLFAFTGSFNPVPISKGIWDPITNTVGKFSRLLVDPIRKRVYLLLGPILTTPIDYIWVGDYYLGYESENIRWSKLKITAETTWDGFRGIILQQLPTIAPYPLLTTVFKSTTYFYTTTQKPGIIVDTNGASASNAIAWLYDTGYTPNEKGDLYTFAFVRVRAINASSSFRVSTCELDSDTFTTLVSEVIGTTPAKFFTYPMSLVGEKVRFRLWGSTRALVNKMVIFASEYGKNRAR